MRCLYYRVEPSVRPAGRVCVPMGRLGIKCCAGYGSGSEYTQLEAAPPHNSRQNPTPPGLSPTYIMISHQARCYYKGISGRATLLI